MPSVIVIPVAVAIPKVFVIYHNLTWVQRFFGVDFIQSENNNDDNIHDDSNKFKIWRHS